MDRPHATQALISLHVAHTQAPSYSSLRAALNHHLEQNAAILGGNMYGIIVLLNAPGSHLLFYPSFICSSPYISVTEGSLSVTLEPVPLRGNDGPPTLTASDDAFTMKVDDSVSTFPPVGTTLAPHEGRQMGPGPYLGSPGIKEDLDLFDPRLHDFRPSLIGRSFDEGEEDVVVPYNWDEQCQYQDSLLPREGASAAPDAGHRRLPSGSTLSLDSPLRLVSRQEDQYVGCSEAALYKPARPLYPTVRSVSFSPMDWRNATMPGAHQSDDEIDHLMEGLRGLSINDEKADPPIPTVPTVPLPTEIPTEFARDATASPVLPQRPKRFRIFSDLESAFDESRLTYLSGLLNRKPFDLPFLRDSAAQPCFSDSEPAPKRLRGDNVRQSGRIALGKERKGSSTLRTSRRDTRAARNGRRAKQAPRDRGPPACVELTPLPCTDRTLTSNKDPFGATSLFLLYCCSRFNLN
jgi:hypothetical protein